MALRVIGRPGNYEKMLRSGTNTSCEVISAFISPFLFLSSATTLCFPLFLTSCAENERTTTYVFLQEEYPDQEQGATQCGVEGDQCVVWIGFDDLCQVLGTQHEQDVCAVQDCEEPELQKGIFDEELFGWPWSGERGPWTTVLSYDLYHFPSCASY